MLTWCILSLHSSFLSLASSLLSRSFARSPIHLVSPGFSSGFCLPTRLLFSSSSCRSDLICPASILGRYHFPLICILTKHESVVYAVGLLPLPYVSAQLHNGLFSHVVGVLECNCLGQVFGVDEL